MDVADGEDEVVFKHDLRGDFARDDFFKQGFAHNILTAKYAKYAKGRNKPNPDFGFA
jgi:hypothetical protein